MTCRSREGYGQRNRGRAGGEEGDRGKKHKRREEDGLGVKGRDAVWGRGEEVRQRALGMSCDWSTVDPLIDAILFLHNVMLCCSVL